MSSLDDKLRKIVLGGFEPDAWFGTVAQIKQCFIEEGWVEPDGNS